MTNHTDLDKVIDALLAEHGLASDLRPLVDANAPPDHWLRQTMKSGSAEAQRATIAPVHHS
ncbi:MAG: hypothetical protein H0T42_07465 [Deltaproteobacteria bacterium]|nr:hypothetical protein [Deltaproteobacteria bacterium]